MEINGNQWHSMEIQWSNMPEGHQDDISVEAGGVWGTLIYFPWPPIMLKYVVPLLLTSPRSFRGVDAEPDPFRGVYAVSWWGRRENGARVG